MAVGPRTSLAAVDLGLRALGLRHLAVGHRARLDPLFDTLLLVDVALHVSLHALTGRAGRIAGLRVALQVFDLLALTVLRALDTRCLGRRHAAVARRVLLHGVDAR